MSIKEKDLQTIKQLSDGDKIRVVTGEGGSRNIPADKVGVNGGIQFIPKLNNEGMAYIDYTFNQITAMLDNGIYPILVQTDIDEGYSEYILQALIYVCDNGENTEEPDERYVVKFKTENSSIEFVQSTADLPLHETSVL
jgi:hypothetical protein